MRDFLDGLFNLSKTIVVGVVIVVVVLLIMMGMIVGLALG